MGGTAGYMAPELVELEKALNKGSPISAEQVACLSAPALDLFSLGKLTHYALTGGAPSPSPRILPQPNASPPSRWLMADGRDGPTADCLIAGGRFANPQCTRTRRSNSSASRRRPRASCAAPRLSAKPLRAARAPRTCRGARTSQCRPKPCWQRSRRPRPRSDRRRARWSCATGSRSWRRHQSSCLHRSSSEWRDAEHPNGTC